MCLIRLSPSTEVINVLRKLKLEICEYQKRIQIEITYKFVCLVSNFVPNAESVSIKRLIDESLEPGVGDQEILKYRNK